MDPREKRRLGRAPLDVTVLGFGGAPLGGFRGAIEEAEAASTLTAALHAGIGYFDTAPFYGYGRSELRVGQALRELPRESFVLSTKVGRWMEPLDRTAEPPADRRPGGLPFQPRVDYSADGARRSLEQSMMRLGLAEIDIVLIHDVDAFSHGSDEAARMRYREALAGCYPYLESLRESGVVSAIGVGLNETPMSLRFAMETDIDCILLAGRYTLLEQDALRELLPLCVEKDIAVILGGPFNSGVLAVGLTEAARYDYGPVPGAVAAKVKALAAICSRHGVDMPAAALQFPLAHPAIRSVIPGAMSRAELQANVQYLSQPIPADFWAELKHERLIPEGAPVPAQP